MNRDQLQALPGRGIKPWVSLLAHRKLAFVVFLLVVFAGLPVVWIKGQAMYATTATVQVAPKYMRNIRDDGELSFPSNTQYREFLEQQKNSVLRYDIVQDALRSLGDRAVLWRKANESERLAVDRLRTQMATRVIPDTYMIEISLQSAEKQGLEEIVNAVVQVYLERMKNERIYGADVRQRNLEKREAALLLMIQQMTKQRTDLALQLGIASFDDKVENPYDRLLNDQRGLLIEARNKRIDAEAKLAAFQKFGETDITTRSIQEAVLIDPGLANLKSNLYKRRADILAQLTGLTTAHPAYSELKGELKSIEQELEQQAQQLTSKVASSVLARLQTTLAQNQQAEAALAQGVSEQEQQGQHFANLYNQALTLTYDLEQNRKELDAIRERLNEFNAEQNSFGFVRLVTPALAPELPYGPGKKKLLLMLLMAALFAAVALPCVLDLLDKRIHTVNDAERVLGVSALGWMLEQQDQSSVLFNQDLLRRMAGALLREQQQHGTHVFAFSAVKPGAGCSELVLQLAQTLTQLGYRSLAVEANAFKPDARFVGAGDLQAWLNTQQGLIQAAEAGLPERIGVGNHAKRHLDCIDQLSGLCQIWQQDYRFILVDLPPLLLSADAEILGQQLQHFILVTEAACTQRGELTRAGRLMEKIAPAAVGLIVNRIKSFSGGGYLRDVMLEYLSARKHSHYFSLANWKLQLQIVKTRYQLRSRSKS